MTSTQHARPLRRKFGLVLHRWHRRIGVAASLFVLWMVFSGWLLNHTSTLDLAHRWVRIPWITARYGLHIDMPQRTFIDGGHWVVASGDTLLFDGKKIDVELTRPLGLVVANHMAYIANASRLLLLTEDGAIVDTLDASLLPVHHIEKIGSGCAGVVVAERDSRVATRDGVGWSPCPGEVHWAQSAALTAAQRLQVTAQLQPGISQEQLLLDLHSGRFFGRWGPYFIDAVGFALMLLALSGLWMFTRHRRQHRR